MSFRVPTIELENITDIVPGNKKLCDIPGKIKIPALGDTVQILHIISTTCQACIDDLPEWQKFPEELYKQLIMNQKKPRIEFINLIDNKNRQDILTKLITPIGNDTVQKKLKDVNVSLCLGLITYDEIKAMNIDLLPTTIILKNGSISHTLSGPIYATDLNKLSNIVSSLVK